MDTTFERKFLNKEGTVEWFTPPEIVNSLGKFDLDPCTSNLCPFSFADKRFTINEDGLIQQWVGRIWCNPPYGKESKLWLEKLSIHGDGIALIFARTETKAFFDYIWDKADAILFFKGRIKFFDIEGKQTQSAGAPSCLVAYGKNNVKALENSGLKGKIVYL